MKPKVCKKCGETINNKSKNSSVCLICLCMCDQCGKFKRKPSLKFNDSMRVLAYLMRIEWCKCNRDKADDGFWDRISTKD